jgi:hypothetical protein
MRIRLSLNLRLASQKAAEFEQRARQEGKVTSGVNGNLTVNSASKLLSSGIRN